ncbi:MAG: MoaF C-terminal domain-containing protein [Novosphingobium sp.]
MTKTTAPTAWPEIEDILVNHGEGAPAPVQPPAGPIVLVDPDTGDTLSLETASVSLGGSHFPATWYAIRPGIYLIDAETGASGTTRLIVVDAPAGRALQADVIAPLPNMPDSLIERIAATGSQSAVGITWRNWYAPDAEQNGFGPSNLLIGRQLRYTYSSTHQYDHYYITDRYYAWHCLKGPDAGLGDFDECRHIALADDLVLFVWKEKLLPCVGFTIEDHAAMRTIGKIYGANSSSGAASGTIVGADIAFIADISGS